MESLCATFFLAILLTGQANKIAIIIIVIVIILFMTLFFVMLDRDVGSMRVHTLPNFWIHASGDHAVAAR